MAAATTMPKQPSRAEDSATWRGPFTSTLPPKEIVMSLKAPPEAATHNMASARKEKK
jgi:hypothetical protein